VATNIAVSRSRSSGSTNLSVPVITGLLWAWLRSGLKHAFTAVSAIVVGAEALATSRRSALAPDADATPLADQKTSARSIQTLQHRALDPLGVPSPRWQEPGPAEAGSSSWKGTGSRQTPDRLGVAAALCSR